MALACMLARLFDLKNVWTERDIAQPVRFFFLPDCLSLLLFLFSTTPEIIRACRWCCLDDHL